MAQMRRRTDDDLFMTQAYPRESAESSRAPSPTATRGLEHSQSSLTDERVPLLKSAGRSRVRIQSAVELPGGRGLSRRQSNHGNFNHSLNDIVVNASCRKFTAVETPQSHGFMELPPSHRPYI
jgi:chloride channel 3/4/5